MPETERFALVAMDSQVHEPLTYRIPDGMDARVGSPVVVPLRRATTRGVVVATDIARPAFACRPIEGVVPGIVPPAVLSLAAWASTYYRCPVGRLLAVAVPSAVIDGVERRQEIVATRVEGFDVARLTAKQAAAYAAMPSGEHRRSDIVSSGACSASILAVLVAKGAVTEERISVDHDPKPDRPAERPAPTTEQATAIGAIDGIPGTTLLYGVTGSGKTIVYFELIERVLARGSSALVLMPEIALTTALAGRFLARFGREQVVVWHSGMSDGARAEAFTRVVSGRPLVVVGPRSALWAPIAAHGIIIVDEEHDQSFKDSGSLGWNARDLAVVLGSKAKAPVVLGSATPSMETWHNAKTGRYRVARLMSRPGTAVMPTVEVIDMNRADGDAGRPTPVAPRLVHEVASCLARGEQSIILLNRRGWSPSVACGRCGHVPACRSCSTSLVFHRGSEAMKCHRCGAIERAVPACPACGGPLNGRGFGTERLEEMLATEVPGLRTLRLDADTVGARGHGRIVERFAAGEADALIGTQMVAKGLDFPRVTLVGVINADGALWTDDIRASERTFQLVCQVSGRAGRSADRGRVFIQAKRLDEPAIRHAIDGDHLAFYTGEAAARGVMAPPFAAMVRFVWEDPKPERADKAAAMGMAAVSAAASGRADVRISGPDPAPLERLSGRHRRHGVLAVGGKTPRATAQAILDAVSPTPAGFRRALGGDITSLTVDVDPLDFA